MPIFNFACKQCGKKFDLMISNAQKNQAKCPECGSLEIKQLLSAFNTASPARGGSANACQGCPGAAGGCGMRN